MNTEGLLLGLNEMREAKHLSQRCHILSIQNKEVIIVSYYPRAKSYHSVRLLPRANIKTR